MSFTCGLSVTLSSIAWPIGPSMTFSICSVLRNRNGRLNTLRSATTGPSAPTLTRASCKGADLGLLDRLLFAAELHRGIHLDADAAAGRRFELLAHVFDRLHGRVALGVYVRSLQHRRRLCPRV